MIQKKVVSFNAIVKPLILVAIKIPIITPAITVGNLLFGTVANIVSNKGSSGLGSVVPT